MNSQKRKEKKFLNSKFPKILKLSAGGEPLDWIEYQEYAYYASQNKILYGLGKFQYTLHGGTNAKSGLQSVIEMDSIIAIKNDHSPFKHKKSKTPALTNSTLFARDKNLCAYCGHVFNGKKQLTRDHIQPVSKGGKDTWVNCVTACYPCNNWKDNKTLDEAELKLLYVPYAPSFHEHLILQNRNILQDQMEYLLSGVSEDSPVYKDYMAKKAA